MLGLSNIAQKGEAAREKYEVWIYHCRYIFGKREGGFGMKTFDEVLAEDLKDPVFRRAYEESEKALQVFAEILKARFEAGLTQEAVAQRMERARPLSLGWKAIWPMAAIPR